MPALDTDFQNRFAAAVMKTVIDMTIAEGSDGKRVAMIPAAEIIDSMITMIAMLSAGSSEAATPAKVRQISDEIAKRVRMRILSAQRQESPFQTISLGEAS